MTIAVGCYALLTGGAVGLAFARRHQWLIAIVCGVALGIVAVVLSAGHTGPPVAVLAVLPAWLAIFLVDAAEHRIPDLLSWGSAAVLIGGLALQGVLQGQLEQLGRALLVGGGLFVAAAVTALVSSLGWGDVKLALSLGLALGWQGVPALIIGAGCATASTALVAIALLASGRGRTAHLPLGPFWIGGAICGLLLTTF